MLATAVVLSSCTFLDSFVPKKGATSDVLDRQQNLTADDFRDINRIDKTPEGKAALEATAALGAPPLPDMAQVLAAPRPPKVANTKLVTLSVTEDVPLRDVLLELGRLAGVDIEVGPGLDKAGVNLRATDRPFNEVIDRLATLGNLRYSAEGSAIRVEKDTPYIKNYSLDFLNLVRSSNSTYSINTNALASGSGGGGGGGSSSGSSGGGGSEGVGTVGNGSTTSTITGSSESDLWSALESSVKEILAYQAPGQADPAAAPAAGGASSGGLVINRQTGVLTVSATDRQHDMIKRLIDLVSRNAGGQVLIEAKIVEVALQDQFLSGIDWNKILAGLGNYNPAGLNQGTLLLPSSGSRLVNNGQGALTFSINHGDLDAVVGMTQRFGTTRTLSSPRLSAMNNQQAVLTFARNEVFFNCTLPEGSSTSSTGGTTTTTQPSVDCETQTVPIGIVLNILPTVNLDKQEVTLNVRPTLTREVGQVENPGVAISARAVGLSLQGFVPVVEVRELDSVMKVKSGGVMVIGGLMEDAARNEEIGAPGINEIPILGSLFKSRSEDALKRELVIFIKATIVNPDGSSGPIDRAVYEKYVTDPRPLFPKQ